MITYREILTEKDGFQTEFDSKTGDDLFDVVPTGIVIGKTLIKKISQLNGIKVKKNAKLIKGEKLAKKTQKHLNTVFKDYPDVYHHVVKIVDGRYRP